MKVLVVTNYKADNRISYFVSDQIEAITQVAPDIHIKVYTKKGSGILGYLRNLKYLRQTIKEYQPDVIHAHYGFCGALACIQREVPVITTYHGSDINIYKNRIVSSFAIRNSQSNIFVSQLLARKAKCAQMEHSYIIPCGISTDLFIPMDKKECRKRFGMDLQSKYILFPASKNSKVKNYNLAHELIDTYNKKNPKHLFLMELDGYKREEVPALINAVDVLLMTSHTEGSPQVIKEAIACGCPIVSVPVGDVKLMTADIPNAFVSSSYEVDELLPLMTKALNSESYSEGKSILRELGYDNESIALRIVEIYKQFVK